MAGVPLAFGAEVPIPEGTRVHWDFGDGKSADGIPVRHAFALPGAYRVAIVVHDANGERKAEAEVTVQRRGPMASAPLQAGWVVALDRLVEKLPVYLSLADRFGASEKARGILDRVESLAGVDLARPENATASGIDPDKGIALVAFSDEPTALYLTLGLLDEALAEATIQRAAQKHQAFASSNPDGSTSLKTGKDEVAYLIDRGYLVLRSANTAEPARNFSAFRNTPPEGLSGSPAYLQAKARFIRESPAGDRHGEDLGVWIAPATLFDPRSSVVNPTVRAIRSGLSGITILGSIDGRGGEFRVWAGVEGSVPEAGIREVFTSAHGMKGGWGELASRAPLENAVGYLSLNAAPEQLAELLFGSPADAHRDRVSRSLRERTGLEMESLLMLFDGDFKAAAYFDAREFYRTLLSRGDPMASGGLVASMGVRDGPAAEKELLRAIRARGFRPDVAKGPEGAIYEADFGSVRGAAALRGETLLFSLGPDLLRLALSKDETTRRYGPDLKRAVPTAAFEPGHQFMYLDVGKVVDAVRSPPEIVGVDPMHLALIRAVVGTFIEQIGPVQDAFLDVWPEKNGIAGECRIRLR